VQDSKNSYLARVAEIRDRVAARLTGRARNWRTVAVGAAAFVGFGLAATGVIVAANDDPIPTTAAVAQQGAAERDDAANRADRSTRTSPSASPSQAKPSASKATTKAPTKAPATKTPTKAPSKAATTKPAPAWVHPMPGAQVTSCFGPRWGTAHEGMDYAKPAGTPILSVGAGTVVKSGEAWDGYGNSVFVDHGNGYLTHYAHMSKTAVSYGQKVKTGQVLGYEGSTGDSTGPHLHFEVHKGMWNQIEPASWLRAHGVNPGGC
jgi:murein DD-endopeptidase MepM/ murein hydrolase activator NlpD